MHVIKLDEISKAKAPLCILVGVLIIHTFGFEELIFFQDRPIAKAARVKIHGNDQCSLGFFALKETGDFLVFDVLRGHEPVADEQDGDITVGDFLLDSFVPILTKGDFFIGPNIQLAERQAGGCRLKVVPEHFEVFPVEMSVRNKTFDDRFFRFHPFRFQFDFG